MKNGINSNDISTWPNRIKSVYDQLIQLGFKIKSFDVKRPWGGFFVIHENDTTLFINHFFPEMEEELRNQTNQFQPKILCVAPNKKLSWQYHDRRSELWKLIEGKSAMKRSLNDEEGEIEVMKINASVILKQQERHRLIGLNKWGVIAEIWIHTYENEPSDEEDIHRLSDLYGR